MAEYPSVAKAQVEAGMPPYLSAQLQRGQVLKKTIVYKAGNTATPASSTIVDIPLPPGVVIDVSSIALTHDGVGKGTYSLNIQVLDKAGNAKYSGTGMLSLEATATAGEIVRVTSTSSLSPAGAMIFDPAQYLVDNGIMIDGQTITYELLKEKYNIACIVSNTADVTANKSLTIVMDLIIP
jgi:hypothetical protein